MTADHNRNLNLLMDPPSKGLLANLCYSLKCLLFSIGATIARTLLLVLLYTLWIPFLIYAIRWILLN